MQWAGTPGLARRLVLGGGADNWWARQDLNLGPMDYESTALTAELRALLHSIYHDLNVLLNHL
jgi:hypothetical protein